MSNTTTTAVDWLIEQTRRPEWHSLKRGDIIEQAKAMEREQIIEAHHQGEMNVLEGIFETELTEARNDKEDATMYYAKTYGKSE